MKILGLDIGTYSVKVAELDVTSKGYVLVGFQEMPLSLDPQAANRKLDIIENLRQLSTSYDSSNTRWIMGIPQDRVSVHQKRFPFRERQKIQKSLAFELEDEIPFDIDDTVFDVKVTEYAGTFAETLTVASPKEAVQEILDLAKDGGFDVDIVSVEGLALANLFENPEGAPLERLAPPTEEQQLISDRLPKSARLILHLGNTRSNLLVYRDGALVAVRSVQWGGADIANAVVQEFQVPIFEAVKVLESRSFILMNSAGATKDQVHLSNTIASSVDGLLGELRLMLLEIRSEFNLKFDGLDITGGAGQIQNLGAYLTQNLEIPANVIRPFENLKQVRMEFTAHMEAVSVVAVGLALEGVKRPRNPAINLRKDEFALENESIKRFWQTWQLPIQIGVAMFALFFVFSVVRDSMAVGLNEKADEHISEMGKKVANLKGESASQTGVESYISKQKKLIRDREALSKAENVNSAMDVLAKIAGKVPVIKPPRIGAGLNVSHLNIDSDNVRIEGTIDQANVKILESALTEIAKPKTFKRESSAPPGAAGVPFAFSFKVERTKL